MNPPGQECWSGQPLPSPGDLPDQELNLGLLHRRWTLHHQSHQGSPPVSAQIMLHYHRLPQTP